jgi:hypothetical protein
MNCSACRSWASQLLCCSGCQAQAVATRCTWALGPHVIVTSTMCCSSDSSCCWRCFSTTLLWIHTWNVCTWNVCVCWATDFPVYASSLSTLIPVVCINHVLSWRQWMIQLAVSVCVSGSQHRCHAYCLCFDLEASVAWRPNSRHSSW